MPLGFGLLGFLFSVVLGVTQMVVGAWVLVYCFDACV